MVIHLTSEPLKTNSALYTRVPRWIRYQDVNLVPTSLLVDGLETVLLRPVSNLSLIQ